MAGTIDLVQRCYAGVELREGEVVVRPWMPRGLRAVGFPVFWHGLRLDIRVGGGWVRIQAGPAGAVPEGPLIVRVGDESIPVAPGSVIERALPGTA